MAGNLLVLPACVRAVPESSRCERKGAGRELLLALNRQQQSLLWGLAGTVLTMHQAARAYGCGWGFVAPLRDRATACMHSAFDGACCCLLGPASGCEGSAMIPKAVCYVIVRMWHPGSVSKAGLAPCCISLYSVLLPVSDMPAVGMLPDLFG